ncbi:protein rep [Domibacillus enclensis]|nr:protein rep [Domibacillus enclensis]
MDINKHIALNDSYKNGKKKPWRLRKKQSNQLANSYKRIGEINKSLRVGSCGNVLLFQECPDGHQKQLVRAFFCKVRLCPMCAWRRSLKIVQQLKSMTHIVNQSHSLKWVFLTLTVKNVSGPELDETIRHMFQSWQRLSQRKVFKDNVKGWFRALEVTRSNSDGSYHPHIHVLLAVTAGYFAGKNYVRKEKWRVLWQEALRSDYMPVVDIRKVKVKRNPNQEAETLKSEEQKRALEAAILETAKYPVKPASYAVPGNRQGTDDAVRHLDRALRGKRMIAFGGVLKQAQQKWNNENNGEAETLTDGEKKECQCATCGSNMLEHLYTWNIGLSNYIEHEH